MAQKRNPLTPADDPTAGTYTARGKSPRQVERDIDHTRSEMSETLDALSDRLDPSHLKEQAMDQAKDFLAGPASDVGTSILDTVKEHPVPALAAALSIGWLVVKSGESDQDRRFEEEHYRRTGRYPAPGYASYVRRTGRQYGTYDTGDYGGTYDADSGSDSGRSLTDKASDKVSDVKGKASDLADQATDKLGDAGDQMHRYQRRASNWLEQQLHQSPMLVGAVALAAGALVGLSVPETRKEDELMGRQSDRLVDRAKDMADDKIDQAKQVVQETAAKAKSKAKDVAETAKEEAKDVAGTAKKEAKKNLGSGSSKAASTSSSSKTSASKAKSTASKASSSEQSGMEALEAKTKAVRAKKKAGSN